MRMMIKAKHDENTEISKLGDGFILHEKDLSYLQCI